MSGKPRPLVFGVAMPEGSRARRWHERLVDELRAAGACDVVYYTVAAHVPVDRRWLMRRAERRVPALTEADWSAVTWHQWAGQHAADLDFVLSFADRSAAIELGAGTRFGCWSFIPGPDPAVGLLNRYVAGEPIMTVELHRDGPTVGEHRLLHQGVFRRDHGSFGRTLNGVLNAVVDWPVRALRNATHDGSCSPPQSVEGVMENGGRSARRVPLRMLLARTKALVRSEIWNVGVADWPGLDPAGGPVAVEPRWLPAPPRGHYLSDPFPLHGGADGLTILAEDYDIATRTGRLVTTRWHPGSAGEGRWTPAFHTPHHASYPFVVRTIDGTFCVPECLRSGELAAWRLNDDDTWTKAATLINGRRLVDSTFHHHKGRWWIFATDEDRGPDTNLYAWYASTFFGPWHPHPLNPVKTDVRSSRSAGPLFSIGDRLIRPAQDCSRTYGGQIVLNEIVRLDEHSFEERTVGMVRIADGSAYPQGPHTLTFLGPHLVLIDGKRTELVDVRVALWRLRHRAANLARRAALRRRC